MLPKPLPSRLLLFMTFSSDDGASGCDSRTGCERGPACVRELFKNTPSPAYQHIFDCGDTQDHKLLQIAIATLRDMVPQANLLIVGGTDDLNLNPLKAIKG